ncbi:hypothetical protein PHMEG_0008384 [Phytophthora megakarya]|uniref:Uncharacterized protein n=1 Tax=Phytophthora megakarya TaxID=4795 RepID=A0A225WIX7_9STRA|nr:hypothetical protein PHMEG_0008384 [Phytophthora megakarya]
MWPHTSRDSTVAGGAVDVNEVTKPVRLVWQELHSLFYKSDSNVVVDLSESQVVFCIYSGRALHYSGDVHESMEIPQLLLALNEKLFFFQFHFVLLDLPRYPNNTIFVDGTLRCVPRNYERCVDFMVHDQASGMLIPAFYILSTSRGGIAYCDMIHFVVQSTYQQLV